MNKTRCLKGLTVLFLIIFLTAGGSACVGQPEVESRAWIDFPLEDSEIVVGVPVTITSHLYAKDGVKEFGISVNGEEITHGLPPNPEETFIEINQEWIPGQAGQHTIEVAIYDPNGIASSKAQVDIIVIGEIASPQPEETSSPSPSQSPVAETTLAPTSTTASLPTFSPTFTQPPPKPTSTIPPQPTSTVTPDTTPPNISNLQASVDPIVEEPCQPDSVTISAQVSDASGLSQVKLYYRVVKGVQNGTWQTPAMGAAGGDKYQLTLGPGQFRASMNPYHGSILQYIVWAWDNKGNTAHSSSGNVYIGVCVQ